MSDATPRVLKAFCDETCAATDVPVTGVGGYVFDEDGEARFNEH
jgi:hypothetical protein